MNCFLNCVVVLAIVIVVALVVAVVVVVAAFLQLFGRGLAKSTRVKKSQMIRLRSREIQNLRDKGQPDKELNERLLLCAIV